MAIKQRLSKLEKRLKPVEPRIVRIKDMVRIPDGLTRAEQDAVKKNYMPARSAGRVWHYL